MRILKGETKDIKIPNVLISTKNVENEGVFEEKKIRIKKDMLTNHDLFDFTMEIQNLMVSLPGRLAEDDELNSLILSFANAHGDHC